MYVCVNLTCVILCELTKVKRDIYLIVNMDTSVIDVKGREKRGKFPELIA